MMARNGQSGSGIDWDLERELASRGYSFDDTDASQDYFDLDMNGHYDEFCLPEDRVPMRIEGARTRSDFNLPSAFPITSRGRGRGLDRQSLNDLSPGDYAARGYYDIDASGLANMFNRMQTNDSYVANTGSNAWEGITTPFSNPVRRARDNGLEGTPGRGKPYTPRRSAASGNDNLLEKQVPGTPGTRVPAAPPVFMARGAKTPKIVVTKENGKASSSAPPKRSSGVNGSTNWTTKPSTPKYFTWQDTDDYRKTTEMHGEAQAATMFPPKPPSSLKREDIVRPTVWKSSPVTPQIDYQCRDTPRPAASSSASRFLPTRINEMSVDEKRRSAVRSLPEEPLADDPDVITIAVKLPCGKQTRRRFYKTDSLRMLKSFIWSQKAAPNNFQVYANCPRRILECDSTSRNPIVDTFESAGITTNETLHVDRLK